MLFPAVITVIADSLVALNRISKFLTAEDMPEPYSLMPSGDYAVDIDGDFKWETTHKPGSYTGKPRRKAKEKPKGARKPSDTGKIQGLFHPRKRTPDQLLPTNTTESRYPDEKLEKRSIESDVEKPFELTNIKLKIPKGAFVAIVGRVGSGKVRCEKMFPPLRCGI